MNKLKYLKELDELKLNINDYAIGGSGPLVIRGLKESNRDIDILVNNKVWNELSNKLEILEIEINKKLVKYIQYKNIAILNSVQGFEDSEIEKVIDRADIIEGYSFVSLEDTIICKKSSGREKDLKQVDKIKEYILKDN
ncbi:MAG: hypothetical protein N4A47_03395 [Clostridia bacterium]|jgi:predicted nucleotidyltransferase|nr:hypothetical protein [Clostridia bacterium]